MLNDHNVFFTSPSFFFWHTFQGGSPGIEATLSRVSWRPALYGDQGDPVLKGFPGGPRYGDQGDPLKSFSAARLLPTEVGIVGAVVFIGEELFILTTLVLCCAHKDMR